MSDKQNQKSDCARCSPVAKETDAGDHAFQFGITLPGGQRKGSVQKRHFHAKSMSIDDIDPKSDDFPCGTLRKEIQ